MCQRCCTTCKEQSEQTDAVFPSNATPWKDKLIKTSREARTEAINEITREISFLSLEYDVEDQSLFCEASHDLILDDVKSLSQEESKPCFRDIATSLGMETRHIPLPRPLDDGPSPFEALVKSDLKKRIDNVRNQLGDFLEESEILTPDLLAKLERRSVNAVKSSGEHFEKQERLRETVRVELARNAVKAINLIIDSFAPYCGELPDEIRKYIIQRLSSDALKAAETSIEADNKEPPDPECFFLESMNFIFDENKKKYFINGRLSNDPSSLSLQRDKFMYACLAVIDGQMRRSPIARLASSLIVHALPKKDADKFRNWKTGHKLFGQKARASACQDLDKAIAGNLLRHAPRTIEKVSEACLVYALTCMLSTENVGVWSWGHKTKMIETLGGILKTKFVLPKIFTRKSPQDIWEDYLDRVSTDENAPRTKLGMTLFREILRKLLWWPENSFV
jgi:hypothetical protein